LPLLLLLLGPFEARRASGGDITLPTRKAEALLAYLALAPGRPHSRDRLTDLLWSDRSGEQARNSLRHALSALKKSLSDLDPAPLAIERTAVEASADAIDVDAIEFERLAGHGTPSALERATTLYRGEFCEGMVIRDAACEEWLAATRDRYRRLAVEVFEQLTVQRRREGDAQGAIETGERLVSLDPLRESAWRALMRAYSEGGQRNHALKAFKRCCEAIARELGVEPEAETKELHESLRSGVSSESRALQTPVSTIEAGHRREAAPIEADDPTIAVLPFDNLSGDPEQEYFSDGITEGIILGLSWYPSLIVKSRHSCFALKNKRVDETEVGRMLGVRYVVEGSVRKTPGHVRITAQLVDAERGTQIWGQRFDSEMEALFSLEDEVTRTIVATVRGRIDAADQNVAFRRPARDLRSYDYLMRGMHLNLQFDPDLNLEAKEMLSRCLELDPDNARAHAYLGASYVMDWNNRWVDDLDNAMRKADFHMNKAVELSPDEPTGQSMLGMQALLARDYEKAEHHLRQSAALNPHDVDTQAVLSFLLSVVGKSDEAIRVAESVVRRDPYHPWHGWHLGITFFTVRDYENALIAFRDVPHPAPEVHGWLAATQVKLGELEQARASMQEFLTSARAEMVNFPATMKEMRGYWHDVSAYCNSSDLDHLFDALLKAGLTVDPD